MIALNLRSLKVRAQVSQLNTKMNTIFMELGTTKSLNKRKDAVIEEDLLSNITHKI